MKFFLDTASLKDISWAAQAGLIDGITTNPSLLAKQAGDVDPEDVLKEICSLVDGPVSAEVVAVDTDGMVTEGRRLAKIADNIVVKIPMLEAGLVAVRRLTAEGIRTNVTLCFSSVQCLLAAKAGATFVSPFIGRLDDVGQDGMDVIREARTIFEEVLRCRNHVGLLSEDIEPKTGELWGKPTGVDAQSRREGFERNLRLPGAALDDECASALLELRRERGGRIESRTDRSEE